ncbi:MAG: SPOR domain-containing protein [Methylococcaceae bacterium]|nr:SPOR domain-containing protein [Methylococcaceae bacterium]OYV23178.1 MAG: Sporulation domain-containing protein [Methylococcaceae bacterium NSO1]
MNQELKQRLIGAVVVTALAAIFIPMLFDDPVDNRGQSVSELVIPATPVNTGEESANKLPTSANQVLNTPNAGSETVVNTEEEAELSANKHLPSDEPLGDEVDEVEGAEQPADEPDEPINDETSPSLDTGAVDKTDKSVKSKKSIQETNDETPIKPEPKIETGATKQTKIKPLTPTTTKKTEKPAVKPVKPGSEFSRWYIQAGSFSKKENAISLMETLRKQGLPATLEATKGLYRMNNPNR